MKSRLFEKVITKVIYFLNKTVTTAPPSVHKQSSIQPISKDPGLCCPRCDGRINLSMEILLSQQAVYCPFCLLKLSIDRDKSSEALAALAKLHSEFQRAHSIVKGTLK